MSSLNGGYHRKQTKAKQNEETIKIHKDLAMYLFKKSCYRRFSDEKHVVFVSACPQTLLTTRFTTFAYKMKNVKRIE